MATFSEQHNVMDYQTVDGNRLHRENVSHADVRSSVENKFHILDESLPHPMPTPPSSCTGKVNSQARLPREKRLPNTADGEKNILSIKCFFFVF